MEKLRKLHEKKEAAEVP